jgi:hypothetical protein
MYARVTITFSEAERKALEDVSRLEMRPLKEQVRFIVRADLVRRGLLPQKDQQDKKGVEDVE